MRTLAATATAAIIALATPAAASAATLAVDPASPCYREQDTVFLTAQSYTPSGFVDFTRDGRLINQLQADASGAISAELRLLDLLSGQRRVTYVGTDTTDPSITAEVSLLVTATDVTVAPDNGPANRLMTIKARGFFGGRTLWAHIVRIGRGARASAARTVRVGPVRGACKRVSAKKRLFRQGTATGRYRVQFDTFRRYRANRAIEYDELIVTVTRVPRP
jgi:hypothetical protein